MKRATLPANVASLARLALLAAAYFAVARVSLGLSFAESNASPVWPPSGMALAALVAGGARLAPGIFVGAFAANLATFASNGAAVWGAATLASAIIATGNVAEALTASWVVRRFAGGSITATPQSAYLFAGGVLVAALVSAVVGVVTLVGLGLVPVAIAWTVWLTWWLGDVTGLLVLSPLLLQWRARRSADSAAPPDWKSIAVCAALFAAAAGLAFGGGLAAGHRDRLATFGMVACIAWAALRCGPTTTVATIFAIAVLSIAATLGGQGPFAKATVNDSLVSLDGFLALCAVTGMVLVASTGRGDRPSGRAADAPGSLLPAGVLLIGLGATIVTWHLVAADTERRAGDRFDDLAEDVEGRLVDRMHIYEQALFGARGLFDASTTVERDEWRRYVRSLAIDRSYPGIQGLGYAERVTEAERPRHVQRVRAQGQPDYEIHPPGPRSEYTPVMYLEPLDERNRRAIGYDMSSDPTRSRAMQRAKESEGPALSGKVRLVQETDSDTQAGFLMYLAIYRAGAPRSTSEERSAALVGYVYAPFRAGDLMRVALQRLDLASISVSVFDGDRPRADDLLYADDMARERGYPHQLARTMLMEVSGRPWTLAVRSTQAFEAQVDTQKAQIALVAGSLISLLLFTVVRALSVMREDALALAHRTSLERVDAERRFASLAESAADGILVLDDAGRVEFCNRAGAALFGLAPTDDLRGRPLHALLRLPRPFDEWRRSLRVEETTSAVLETVRRNEQGAPIPVEVSLGSWAGTGGHYFSVVARDMSDRVEAERNLRDAMEAARQASQAKSQFLANMSHEIRTPMNAVIGLTYLLQQTRLDAEQQGFVSKLKLASATLLALINDVLDLAKIEAGELVVERTAVALRPMLEDLAAVISVQAQAKSIAFVLEAPDDLPEVVELDITRLNQVLTNLLSNAIKFTERGQVSLGVRQVATRAGQACLRFDVRDTGIGIAPAVQARLFAPFVQADASTTRRYGGTGLGLSIVKRLTESMGGRVGFESTPGVGSEFWVELDCPVLAPQAPTTPVPATRHGEGLSLEGVSVLVVDDSDVNLDVARRMLELHGVRVGVAANGLQALEQLRTQPRGFDAVLMDVQMPVLDGCEATRRIRRELGLVDLPIIALTAGALTSERQRAADAGMTDFLTKPFDPLSLVRCIQRHVAAREDDRPSAPSPGASQAPGLPWPTIEGIDIAGARGRLPDDPRLYLSLLRRMLTEHGGLAVPSSPDAAQWKAFRTRVHKLLGTSGVLGITAVADLARRLEAACAHDRADEAAELARRLVDELASLSRRAEGVLSATPDG